MADEEGDELLLEDRVEDDESKTEEQGHSEDDLEPQGDGEFEEHVSFDGAAPAPGEGDTGLVRHLREQIRERDRRLAEAEKRQAQPPLGPKPTLETCEYDEEKFEEELEKWHDQKRQTEALGNTQADADQRFREEWSRDHERYQQTRAALQFADRDDTEATALTALNPVQQQALVQAADNPALLLYALGKNPAKLAELSAISNPLKMAAAVAKLEGALKVQRKRKAPDPERIQTGSTRVAPRGSDKELERLEKEAERLNDRTKLIAYKAKLKSQAK